MFTERLPYGTSDVIESSYNDGINRLRESVETVLQETFGRDVGAKPILRAYQGQLSTRAEGVGGLIRRTGGIVSGKCWDFSQELKNGLSQYQIEAKVNGSGLSPYSQEHVYLVTKVEGREVIIDPTIGQYLKGHDHVFIGGRDILKDLVLSQPRKKICDLRSEEDINAFFERKWGSYSKSSAGSESAYELYRD